MCRKVSFYFWHICHYPSDLLIHLSFPFVLLHNPVEATWRHLQSSHCFFRRKLIFFPLLVHHRKNHPVLLTSVCPNAYLSSGRLLFPLSVSGVSYFVHSLLYLPGTSINIFFHHLNYPFLTFRYLYIDVGKSKIISRTSCS